MQVRTIVFDRIERINRIEFDRRNIFEIEVVAAAVRRRRNPEIAFHDQQSPAGIVVVLFRIDIGLVVAVSQSDGAGQRSHADRQKVIPDAFGLVLQTIRRDRLKIDAPFRNVGTFFHFRSVMYVYKAVLIIRPGLFRRLARNDISIGRIAAQRVVPGRRNRYQIFIFAYHVHRCAVIYENAWRIGFVERKFHKILDLGVVLQFDDRTDIVVDRRDV